MRYFLRMANSSSDASAASDPFDFAGRRVLVTGGSKGLGRATAERFLAAGATVTICARRAPEAPVTVDGNAAHFVSCDVRDPAAVTELIAAATAEMGGLDVLINNAGGAPAAAAAESGGSFNEKIVALNLVGPMNLCIAAQPALSAGSEPGVIVNISSISGQRANPMGVAYGAAKAGLINMGKTLALEWGPDIRVLTVTSGPLATDAAAEYFGEAEMARLAGAISMGRLGTSDDVVNAIIFACSPMASWMTGSNLVIDGGPEWPANGFRRSSA